MQGTEDAGERRFSYDYSFNMSNDDEESWECHLGFKIVQFQRVLTPEVGVWFLEMSRQTSSRGTPGYRGTKVAIIGL